MVECLSQDREVAGSSLTSVTALCPWARHIKHSLVLVQPRKTRPYITERLLNKMGCKESNQTNKRSFPHYPFRSFPHYQIRSLPHYPIRSSPHYLIRSIPHYGINRFNCDMTHNTVYQDDNRFQQSGWPKQQERLSQWDCSFEHPKRMLKLIMGKKILTILGSKKFFYLNLGLLPHWRAVCAGLNKLFTHKMPTLTNVVCFGICWNVLEPYLTVSGCSGSTLFASIVKFVNNASK